ncbi:MAG TPA: ATP-binding protein [Rhodocyclaceae bacterium]|nr:ATP-binding protein [Rhodocyclaceae bacterium]
MTTTWFSLRRRLLFLLLGGLLVCWVVTAAWIHADAHHEIDELFDAQMAQTAQALLALTSPHLEEDEHRHGFRELERAVHRYQRNIMCQIWQKDGTLLLRSDNAPAAPLAEAEGYSEVEGAGGHWRYYTQWDRQHRYQVQLAESHQVRDDLIGQIAYRLMLPALLGIPLLGVWVWLATRRGLAPLAAVAGQIADREPQRLHALAPAAAPAEIRPLVEAINGLFARVERALEAERRFTADAAHELRTPLAALAAQAQVILRARDEDERRHAVEQLVASTRRAGHLVDQLLTLARLDPDDAGPALSPLRLDRLAEEVCADHGTAALDKGVDLELDAAPLEIPGNRDMLGILLRNLVDNAIRYTPPGGRVAVAVHADRQGPVLTVADSGPGIPPAERERVFERFHRLAGQEVEGSGLGLSIVARIAQRHGAHIELGAGEGGAGLRVTVRFPSQFRE